MSGAASETLVTRPLAKKVISHPQPCLRRRVYVRLSVALFASFFFCAAFVALKEIQIRFSLPSFFPVAASIHRIAIPPLSGFAVRVASLHPRYFEHTRRKEGGRRKDEEIVSQGHLCNQVTAARATDGDGNDRERVPRWCNTGMEYIVVSVCRDVSVLMELDVVMPMSPPLSRSRDNCRDRH